jgi:hypothetical protein
MPEGIMPLRVPQRSYVGIRCPSGLPPAKCVSIGDSGHSAHPNDQLMWST